MKASQITIIGCGYVGLTTAAIFANCGIRVKAIEINPERLKTIQGGKSFFFEAGVDQLISKALSDGTLTVTDSYEETIPDSGVVFSCVGTPDNPDGSSNLSYVFDAANKAIALMDEGTIFAQKSTVPVGTGEKIEKLFGGKKLSYVSNPEFLREGTAISDTLWFDRVVVGGESVEAVETVLGLYRQMEACRNQLATVAGLEAAASSQTGHYIPTTRNSAELIKVTANAFLALKISFANSIAKLADHADANITEVMDAVGSDHRIGRAFLNAGRGYGGGCFPKDVSGLIRSAEEFGVDMGIMHAASDVNSSMPHYIINRATEALGGTLKNKKIALLGLAFKAGTSDVRRSPAIAIADTLSEQGASVRAYDPEANEEARHDLDQEVTLCDSPESALENAGCLFVTTEWPEFKQLDFASLKQNSNIDLVVDCMNILDKKSIEQLGFTYLGVGR